MARIDLAVQMREMLRAEYFKWTNAGEGMASEEYCRLWPKTVEIPQEYLGRFEHALLVDLTIPLEKMKMNPNVFINTSPNARVDLVRPPTDISDRNLTRYVAFVHLGKRHECRLPEECRLSFSPDEVGLTVVEGFHLPLQHPGELRNRCVELVGSHYPRATEESPDGEFYLDWKSSMPAFGLDFRPTREQRTGPVSRGVRVIPVT